MKDSLAVRIVVIEDQAMVRGLIVRVCRDSLHCAELGEASTAEEGLRCCQAIRPDLVLLDLDLPDRDGIDLVADIRRLVPAVRIIVLSSHTDAYSLHRIQYAGVQGFVDKNEQSPEVLCEAVQTVMRGHTHFSAVVERTQASLRADPRAFNKLLSEREQRLLQLIGQGLANEEIATQCGLSSITVRNHRRNIMGKLGIHSTPELIRYAIEKGFTRIRSG